MFREYSYVSPSLDGVLSHESLSYEGIVRPTEIIRAFDKESAPKEPHKQKILEQYFYDLYGIFMKRLSVFVLEASPVEAETLRLQAMLQEMIKIKKLISEQK